MVIIFSLWKQEDLSLVWQSFFPQERIICRLYTQATLVMVTLLLPQWFQETSMTGFIETANNFITLRSDDKEQKASSSSLPSSISWPTKRHYPVIWDLNIKKNIFLLKTPKCSKLCLYRSHSWPCFDITKQTKSRRAFSDKDSLTWVSLGLTYNIFSTSSNIRQLQQPWSYSLTSSSCTV